MAEKQSRLDGGKHARLLPENHRSLSRGHRRAGVRGEAVHEPKKGSKGRKTWTLSFYSLRHALVREMANAGVSQEIRQHFAGHASAEMNAKYTHHELAPLRAAIATIPGIGKRR